MKMPVKDVELFYKLHWGLLFYANQKYAVIKGVRGPDFRGRKPEDIQKLHKKIYSNPAIIRDFAEENPLKFNGEETGIVKGWEKFITNDFFIVMEHTKDHTIFLAGDEEPRAYGVIGLYDDLADLIPMTPTVIGTTLLPFKGRITYCGVFNSTNLTFGRNAAKDIKADYMKAKSMFGLITSLDQPVHPRTESDEELLRFYAGTEERRMEYGLEIERMLEGNPSLKTAYLHEVGRSNARKAKKRLKELGAVGWFTILGDVITASGKTREEAVQRAKETIPQEKLAAVHAFRVDGKEKHTLDGGDGE